MSRKGHLALIGILVSALLGAYASSMMSAGSFQLNNLVIESGVTKAFKIYATSMEATFVSITNDVLPDGTKVVLLEVETTTIENQRLVKVESDRTVEISADSAVGENVVLKVIDIQADQADFENLVVTGDPFSQTMDKNVMTNVEITAFYLNAETMTLTGMQLSVS